MLIIREKAIKQFEISLGKATRSLCIKACSVLLRIGPAIKAHSLPTCKAFSRSHLGIPTMLLFVPLPNSALLRLTYNGLSTNPHLKKER